MSETLFRLKHPVKVQIESAEGQSIETVDTLTLRRATGEQLLLIDEFQHQPMRLMLEMIAALSGQPLVVIKKLDREDIEALGEFAMPDEVSGSGAGKG